MVKRSDRNRIFGHKNEFMTLFLFDNFAELSLFFWTQVTFPFAWYVVFLEELFSLRHCDARERRCRNNNLLAKVFFYCIAMLFLDFAKDKCHRIFKFDSHIVVRVN